MITCPSCGTTNEPGSRFCFQCGSDIRSVGATTAQQPPAGDAQPSGQSGSFGSPPPPPGFPPTGQQQPGFPPSGQPQQPAGFPPPPPPPPGFPQSGQQQPGFPPQYNTPGGYDPNRPMWNTPSYMSPPEEPKRRRWLWITLGLILGCILLCVIGSVMVGQSDTISDLATSFAEYATEEAE